MQDLQSCGDPIILLHSLRRTGRASVLALASPRTLLFASTSRSWFLSTGRWSPQWSRMGGMTGTGRNLSVRRDPIRVGTCSFLCPSDEYLAVAWSLVGEWTTLTIFLPPKGEWPRQGHPQNLRSVPMLTWVRACFEQGFLPSLLALPGTPH